MTDHAKLCARLVECAPRLTERVLGEMYQNPFWQERFGERATTHGRQDGMYHVQYLVQALTSNDATILESYARWLQQVLTTRGMCTRHLAENFERLAAAITEECWADSAPAVAMLDAARAALRYPDGPARALQDQAPAIARSAADALYAKHPEWLARWGEAGRERCADDLQYHLAYLADSIALGMPEVFTSYVTWIAAFLERRQIPRAHLDESLAALRSALEHVGAGVNLPSM
ncbi:MAG TPA: hypothetical protein VFQ53_16975 [Kofleriaceae bacterium]|nr:hypothetical protein [Kofleriaceae bacterium]